MKYLKKFENFPGDNFSLNVKSNGEKNITDGSTFDADEGLPISANFNIMYTKDWEKYLPEKMTINYKGDLHSFRKGNIMLNGDLVEITYDALDNNTWGSPDTLEFDLYFAKNTHTDKIRMTVDITFGDLMACEFSIEPPNKVNVIEHTTYGSKFDPSNTVFALEDECLDEFIGFLNKFHGMKLTRHDLRFLDKYDNWKE